MHQMLVSKPNVMLSSGVMYLHVLKIKFTELKEPSPAKILLINELTRCIR